jgi:hypothetical protein
VWAKDGPEAYIQTGALAPRIISANAHHSARGAGVPPSASGMSSRQNSAAMNASNDFRNASGIVTLNVAGS